MEKSINNQTKTAISLAKILPIIFLLVSIEFIVFGFSVGFFYYRDQLPLIWDLIWILVLIQLISFFLFWKKLKEESSIKSVILEFLIISALLEISGLLRINQLEAITSGVFIFGGLCFFVWTLIFGVLRINLLSNIGFSIFSSISFITLMMTPHTSWDMAILFASPVICIFIWTIKVRREYLRNSQLESEDFSFSFGYKKGSTGMKKI